MCPRIGRFSLLLKMLSEHSTFPLAWRPCFLPLARAILLQAVETPRGARARFKLAISLLSTPHRPRPRKGLPPHLYCHHELA
ncbi:hypothetical protein BGY98DRAFT_1006981 [Russula aff. rugulosa BPL654]|nr:hypothetical protein BGY98DRAFT_1006981 [Russula aff. rugulosa BPL654]